MTSREKNEFQREDNPLTFVSAERDGRKKWCVTEESLICKKDKFNIFPWRKRRRMIRDSSTKEGG